MDYTKASDFEINTAIANKQGIKWQVCALDQDEIYNVVNGDGINYCENCEDMRPIIADNGISISKINKNDTDWAAFFFWDDTEVYDKNPLRAAAIFYLMMGDA